MTALSGWRVLLPRPTGRSSTLVSRLDAEGAVALAIPMIAITPPADPGALDAAVLALSGGELDWVGFTSVNAVSAVLDRAAALGLDPVVPADTRVAAVGPATAAALRAAHIPVDLLPAHGSAAELAAKWPAAHAGESVLLPQSEIASPVLSNGLSGKGYRVRTVLAYHTTVCPPPPSVAEDLAAGAFDAVLFTSPSTVAAVAGVVIAAGTVIGAIGASTARAVLSAGLPLSFTAAEPSDSGLIAGLIAAAGTRHSHL